HPGVARVLDFGLHVGRPFLVMEHVDGRSLEGIAAEARFPPEAAARLVARVAGAVAAAHGRGVLHCDLKPANVLIDRDGDPRVIDFGLARLFTGGNAGGPHGLSGTPTYMAPEQAAGDPAGLTPRTDVFGRGAGLYFLLTGHPPYPPGPLADLLADVRAAAWDRARLARAGAPARL